MIQRSQIRRTTIKIADGIQVVSVALAMILLVVMTLTISVNVFMRYIMNSGLNWAEEIARLLVVWFTFLAMALGVKQSVHISIHILPKSLPPILNRALDVLKHSIVITVGIIMFIYGNQLVSFSARSILPATGLPGSLLYSIMPISGALIVLEGFLEMINFKSNSTIFDSLFGKGSEDA